MIRQATQSDAADIVRIGRESFVRAFAHLFTSDILARYLDETYSASKIAASLAQPDNLYFVAQSHDSVVGFMKLKRHCSLDLLQGKQQLQLQKIYVQPDAAGPGIGSALMRSGETTIQRHAPVSVWLMVYEGNHRAVSFYQRFGYHAIGNDTHDFENIRVRFTVMKKEYGL